MAGRGLAGQRRPSTHSAVTRTGSSLLPANIPGIAKNKIKDLASLAPFCSGLLCSESPWIPGTTGLIDKHLVLSPSCPAGNSNLLVIHKPPPPHTNPETTLDRTHLVKSVSFGSSAKPPAMQTPNPYFLYNLKVIVSSWKTGLRTRVPMSSRCRRIDGGSFHAFHHDLCCLVFGVSGWTWFIGSPGSGLHLSLFSSAPGHLDTAVKLWGGPGRVGRKGG